MAKCKHTKKPDARALEWRVEMSRKGYVQTQCPGCGEWAVWRKKIINKTP